MEVPPPPPPGFLRMSLIARTAELVSKVLLLEWDSAPAAVLRRPDPGTPKAMLLLAYSLKKQSTKSGTQNTLLFLATPGLGPLGIVSVGPTLSSSARRHECCCASTLKNCCYQLQAAVP